MTRRTKAGGDGGDEPRRRFGPAAETAAFRGFSWGSAVHGALAVAVDDPGEEIIRSACRDLLVEYERPVDDHGEPLELRELLDLVDAVRSSELWARAAAAEKTLAEIAFAVPMPADDEADGVRADAIHGGAGEGDAETGAGPEARPEPGEGATATRKPQGSERRQLDLFGGVDAGNDRPVDDASTSAEASSLRPTAEGGEAEERRADGAVERAQTSTEILEGIVDLAFRESDGWVIADYKTDLGTDPDFPRREADYRRQVELYAEAWMRLTGEVVKERVLFFTAQGRVERW